PRPTTRRSPPRRPARPPRRPSRPSRPAVRWPRTSSWPPCARSSPAASDRPLGTPEPPRTGDTVRGGSAFAAWPGGERPPPGARAGSSGAPSNSADAAADGGEAPATVEQRAATPRLVATYDGGLLVLDSGTLETVADIPLDGFARVNPAGDGRHVAVSTEGGFRLLDAGTWTEPHGDHSHHYTSAPTLTDAGVDAGTPGHVVVHDGKTAFFDDGSGLATVVASDSVADEVAQRR